MKVLICSDSFKDAASSEQIGFALKRGFEAAKPQSFSCQVLPIADGGEGSSSIWKRVGKPLLVDTIDALGHEIKAPIYQLNHLRNAYAITLADASGIQQIPQSERNPRHTSTLGTGVLIRAAIEAGAKLIFLAVGGSATHDLGFGILKGIGFTPFACGEPIAFPTAKDLGFVDDIDLPNDYANISDVKFVVLSDVQNPLLGLNGAANVFAAQKGASSQDKEQIEIASKNAYAFFKQKQGVSLEKNALKHDAYNWAEVKGSGAAGGVSTALATYFDVTIRSGADVFLELIAFDKQIEEFEPDLIITGEGRFDAQSLNGKLVSQVIKRATHLSINCLVIAGQLREAKHLSEVLYNTDVLTLDGQVLFGQQKTQFNKHQEKVIAFLHKIQDTKEGLSLKQQLQQTEKDLESFGQFLAGLLIK